jgi:hypothetical protein
MISTTITPIIELLIDGSCDHFNQQQTAIIGHQRFQLKEPRWNNFEWGRTTSLQTSLPSWSPGQTHRPSFNLLDNPNASLEP